MRERKEDESFTHFEKVCDTHIKNEENWCYCELDGKVCNKGKCPQFK